MGEISRSAKVNSDARILHAAYNALLSRRGGFTETTTDRINFFLRHHPNNRVLSHLGGSLWTWDKRLRYHQTYITVWLSLRGFRTPVGREWRWDQTLRWHLIYRDLARPFDPADTLRRGDPQPPTRDFLERWGVDLLRLEGLLDGHGWLDSPSLGNALPAQQSDARP